MKEVGPSADNGVVEKTGKTGKANIRLPTGEVVEGTTPEKPATNTSTNAKASLQQPSQAVKIAYVLQSLPCKLQPNTWYSQIQVAVWLKLLSWGGSCTCKLSSRNSDPITFVYPKKAPAPPPPAGVFGCLPSMKACEAYPSSLTPSPASWLSVIMLCRFRVAVVADILLHSFCTCMYWWNHPESLSLSCSLDRRQILIGQLLVHSHLQANLVRVAHTPPPRAGGHAGVQECL